MDPREKSDAMVVLGIDTCGPAGSIALARITRSAVEIFAEMPLEGRTYSATLVAAVEALLTQHAVPLRVLTCIVIVNGPGSFTGVRVGLSAAKGLSLGADLPLLAVSRLQVLASAAGAIHAALDAHRHEVFLCLGERELLAGAHDLAAIVPPAHPIAVCDDAAAALLSSLWPSAVLKRHAPPDAADALRLGAPRIRAGDFGDVALLDGHYLRRSDAEIFGEPAHSAAQGRRV